MRLVTHSHWPTALTVAEKGQCSPVWWMRVISAILNFGIFNWPKRIQTPHSLFGTSEQIKPLQPVVQAAVQNWVQVLTSSPCQSSGKYSRRLLKQTIKGLEGKINGQALGAVLLHSFCRSVGQAQTHGVSESATVAANCDRLAWGKHDTSLAIQT